MPWYHTSVQLSHRTSCVQCCRLVHLHRPGGLLPKDRPPRPLPWPSTAPGPPAALLLPPMLPLPPSTPPRPPPWPSRPRPPAPASRPPSGGCWPGLGPEVRVARPGAVLGPMGPGGATTSPPRPSLLRTVCSPRPPIWFARAPMFTPPCWPLMAASWLVREARFRPGPSSWLPRAPPSPSNPPRPCRPCCWLPEPMPCAPSRPIPRD
mmetsp:Transcript_954/g.2573  ORF Transcript_954/g.2573 Transcript_954/m.2573 type:complete len:207 (+) Transcript_954:1636-2256(+)